MKYSVKVFLFFTALQMAIICSSHAALLGLGDVTGSLLGLNSLLGSILNLLGSTLDQLIQVLAALNPDLNCGKICLTGHPVPRAGYQSSSDGCGSQGAKVPVELCPYMTACCDVHDICYDTCGASQKVCDDKLYACLSDNTSLSQLTPDNKLECQTEAALMYLGVRLLGCEPFFKSQNSSCDCSPF